MRKMSRSRVFLSFEKTIYYLSLRLGNKIEYNPVFDHYKYICAWKYLYYRP
jgi:hypothetical protein